MSVCCRCQNLVDDRSGGTDDEVTCDPCAQAELAILRDKIAFLRSEHGHPLDSCDDGECMVCGVLHCPEGEPLHFHHDGCPACSMDDDDPRLPLPVKLDPNMPRDEVVLATTKQRVRVKFDPFE